MENKQTTVFNIANSDSVVPFYYKQEDFKKMLSLVFDTDYEQEYKQHVIQHEGIGYIRELGNTWYPMPNGKESGYVLVKRLFIAHRNEKKINVANFDELVMYYYLVNLVGKENVICQKKLKGNKAYDFVITKDGVHYFLEFDGIGHFIQFGRGNVLEERNLISARRNAFEAEVALNGQERGGYTKENSKLILWPYWVKKCKRNFEIVLGITPNEKGIGAIYSSDRNFAEFPWDGGPASHGITSAKLILEYNKQFNITEDMIGSFYEFNDVLRRRIETGTTSPDILIPKGCQNKALWLPAYCPC